MLPFNLLRAAFLASVLIPWVQLVTIAIPVPVNHHTQYASNHHNLHDHRVQSAQHETHPGDVHIHDVENSWGHKTGSVVVDPNHIDGTSIAQLHVHAEHAAEHLRTHFPHEDYHVQVHHTPGDGHAMIHAVPSYQMSHTGEHAIRLAGPNRPTAPQAPDKQQIFDRLRALNNARDKRFHIETHPSADYGVHSSTRVGTMAISSENLRHGMSAGQLQAHADWVNRHFLPDRFRDKAHLHAHHEVGKNYIELHMMPARKGVTHDEISSFLQHHSDHTPSFNDHPITGNQNYPLHARTEYDNQFTFQGYMRAHTQGYAMTPAQLNIYAAHAKDNIVARHSLEGPDEYDMSISTAHKNGQSHVLYHTQPKTERLLRKRVREGYPAMNQALREAGQLTYSGAEWQHSDQAVVHFSAKNAGVPTTGSGRAFRDYTNGLVLGNAGQGDQPCYSCHRTFRRLDGGLVYHGMDRN